MNSPKKEGGFEPYPGAFKEQFIDPFQKALIKRSKINPPRLNVQKEGGKKKHRHIYNQIRLTDLLKSFCKCGESKPYWIARERKPN